MPPGSRRPRSGGRRAPSGHTISSAVTAAAASPTIQPQSPSAVAAASGPPSRGLLHVPDAAATAIASSHTFRTSVSDVTGRSWPKHAQEAASAPSPPPAAFRFAFQVRHTSQVYAAISATPARAASSPRTPPRTASARPSRISPHGWNRSSQRRRRIRGTPISVHPRRSSGCRSLAIALAISTAARMSAGAIEKGPGTHRCYPQAAGGGRGD